MDIKLNYYEAGSGTTIIFLHGNGEDYSYFENQLIFFSENYHVLAIDTRGQGGSKRGEMPFAISQFADDLCDFMDSKKIDKAIVVGFSDGANIAMEFALRYQDRLQALVLNGANLSFKGIKAIYRIPMLLSYKLARKLEGNKDRANKVELLRIMVEEPNLKREDLATIRVPTLVIAGTKDMIKRSETEAIAAGISGSELCFIRGDHFIAKKCHLEFNEVVSSFLSRFE